MFFFWSKRTPPRIAEVLVIKNEERFLRQHLLYHLKIGVSRVYVYLDECSDRSREIAEAFPEVRIHEVPRDVREVSTYLSDIQCWCYDQALSQARKEGYDWLLAIDPDEFAFADNASGAFSEIMGPELTESTPESFQQAHLAPLLAKLPRSCNMVSLDTRESAPVSTSATSPFWEQVYFQGPTGLPRTILNPITGEKRVWNDVLGHKDGKSLIRTRARVQAKNAHKWTVNQNLRLPKRPRNKPYPFISAGLHYHYVVVSEEQWLEKYSKLQEFPDTWNGGREIEFPKLSWIQATRDLSQADALAYAREWVFLSQEQAENAVSEGALFKDKRLQKLLESI